MPRYRLTRGGFQRPRAHVPVRDTPPSYAGLVIIGIAIGVVVGLVLGLAVHMVRLARVSAQARTAEARLGDAQAAAAEKVKQYQEALKQARARVYAEQEAARKKLLDERAALLKEARNKAAAEVASAKARVMAELGAARREIETTVAQLSAEIARRVLQAPRPRPGSPAREVR